MSCDEPGRPTIVLRTAPGDRRVPGRSAWLLALGFAFGTAACVRAAVPGAGPLASSAPAGRPVAAASSASQEGPVWAELKPGQQAALLPLRAEWPAFDIRSKRKWLELADRFPTLKPAEQARVQARMGEWVRMTPTARGQARLNFQQAKQLAPNERQARWDAYQALSPEEKNRLAAHSAAQAAAPADPLRTAPVRAAGRDSRGSVIPAVGPAGLSSVALPRAIGPTVVQATPGATTTLIDRRPTPPEHQRAGRQRLGAASGAAGVLPPPPRAALTPPGPGASAPVSAQPMPSTPTPPVPPVLPGVAPSIAPPVAPAARLPIGPRSDTEPGAPTR